MQNIWIFSRVCGWNFELLKCMWLGFLLGNHQGIDFGDSIWVLGVKVLVGWLFESL